MPALKIPLLLPAHLLLLFFLLLVSPQEIGAAAVSGPSVSAPTLLSPETLNAKIKEVEETIDLDQATKKNLLELYRKALENLQTAASHDSLAGKYVQSIETAPADLQKIKEKINKLALQPPPDQTEGAAAVSLRDIEQQLLQAKANATTIETDVAALSRQLSDQNGRTVKVGQRLAELKGNEEELLVALKAPAPPTEPAQMWEARNWLQQAQLQALRSEAKMLNQELLSSPVLIGLATAQQEEAAGRLQAARSLVQSLEEKANQKRQDEAAKSIGQAKEEMRQVADSPPALQQAAMKNTELGDALQAVTMALDRLATEKDALEKELAKLEEKSKTIKQKIELAGLSQSLGLLLHEQQRKLPDVRVLRKKAANTEAVIAETGLLQVQYGEEQKLLENIDAYIAELEADASPEVRAEVEPEMRKILLSRRDLLEKLVAFNQSYLGMLSEREIVFSQYIKTVASLNGLLAERLLWTRSAPAMRLKDLFALPREAAAFFSPDQWLATGKLLIHQAVASPVFLLLCLITAALLWWRGRLLSFYETLVKQASHPATYNFTLPLQAFGLSLLLALPWPLLIMGLAWQTHLLAEATSFSLGIAVSLATLSYRYYLLNSFRMLLLPRGLADRFFHWSKESISLLRREVSWLTRRLLPTVFATQLLLTVNFRAGGNFTLGRLAFIATLCILALFLYRTLHPKTGVWHTFLGKSSHRFLERLYPLFFLFILLLPLVLSGLVMAGYVFAVASLVQGLINGIWTILAIIVCHQLIERCLLLSSRRLLLQRAMAIRMQAKSEVPADQPVSEEEAEPIEELETDLVELSEESRKLLDTLAIMGVFFGQWLVWAGILPALRIFNEITLWTSTDVVNGQSTLVPVTLADAGSALFIGIITLAATRNFPSLLKIVLLQHLDMSRGSRYTATTLSRYLIGGTGLIWIANILGFSWSQIQWLVAALGVGIGFGLQEIVANFISGLIILFERPIRVGDVVTVGTTDGTVTRIRIRATTIRDFDRKELLVPNKEFISGRLLNWSLSDPVIRILLPVGIAYGSDVEKAMSLMVQAAEENGLVLDEPKPVVTFDSFGDNALLLTLRCFIGTVDDRVPARSALHQAIDHRFRQAEVSMAFPQRDVHLDTNRPLDIRMVPAEDAPRNGPPPEANDKTEQ